MLRFTCSAVLLVAILPAAGCGEGAADTPFVSEAVAAPAAAQAPDYGWRTDIDPKAREGVVVDYQ